MGQNQPRAGIVADDKIRTMIAAISSARLTAIHPSPQETFGAGDKNIACTLSEISHRIISFIEAPVKSLYSLKNRHFYQNSFISPYPIIL
jgi:hypothetical protein